MVIFQMIGMIAFVGELMNKKTILWRLNMKRQGKFSGKIYDEDYPVKDIEECCHQLSDAECTEEKVQARHINDLSNCIRCFGCPMSQRTIV